MKSEWKVSSQYIDGKIYYQVYRLIDTDATDHSGNRETQQGLYEDKKVAEKMAKYLNMIGAVRRQESCRGNGEVSEHDRGRR